LEKTERKRLIKEFLLFRDEHKKNPDAMFTCHSMNAVIPIDLCNTRRAAKRNAEGPYSRYLFPECRDCDKWQYWQCGEDPPTQDQIVTHGYSERYLSNPPYGFVKYAPMGLRNVVDVNEMEVVKTIIRMRDNPKTFTSFAVIAHYLNKKGLVKRNKKRWKAQSVREVYHKCRVRVASGESL